MTSKVGEVYIPCSFGTLRIVTRLMKVCPSRGTRACVHRRHSASGCQCNLWLHLHHENAHESLPQAVVSHFEIEYIGAADAHLSSGNSHQHGEEREAVPDRRGGTWRHFTNSGAYLDTHAINQPVAHNLLVLPHNPSLAIHIRG